MRKAFISYYDYDLTGLPSWTEITLKVDGGFMCFESVTDTAAWEAKLINGSIRNDTRQYNMVQGRYRSRKN